MVGALFGLTPSKHQSVEKDVTGAITRAGGRHGAQHALRGGDGAPDPDDSLLELEELGPPIDDGDGLHRA
jgi:hypothetical protein